MSDDLKVTSSATPLGKVIPTVGIVGVGLIGGSFGAALKASGCVKRVIGAGRQSHNMQVALERGLIDEVVDLERLAKESDVILLATPVGQIASVLAEILPNLAPHTLIMDAGSTKVVPIEVARQALGERVAQFVPAHPIAGSERSGADAAQVGLYEGRTVVLTPLLENSSTSLALAEALWTLCGAHVLQMSAEQHDQLYASVSHLPHWIAYAYMVQVLQAENAQVRLRMAGTGFRDFTRLAGSSPEMWRDIFFSNKAAMLGEIEAFESVLNDMKKALLNHSAEDLEQFLARAYKGRKDWVFTP